MYRANYQNIEAKPWSTTAVVAFVATASLALGVTAGVLTSGSTQTALYAPVATSVRTVQAAAPVTQMAASNEFVNEFPTEIPQAEEYEVVEPVYVAAQPQGAVNWATGLAAAAAAAVGAAVYKIKSQKAVPSIGPLDVYTKGAIPAATLMAAQPALAMQTNSQAPIATALFIVLPVFFLIVLYVSSQANPDIPSGGYDQDYYDKSKAAGNKKTNEAARLRGAGLGMYADKRSKK